MGPTPTTDSTDWVPVGIFVVILAFLVRGLISTLLRIDMVRAVMRDLGVDPKGVFSLSGAFRGAEFRFVYGKRGRSGPVFTQCWSRWPVAAGLELELRPKTPKEERRLKAGLALTMITGDPAFDAAFVVEAAPSASARTLLDAQTRAALLAIHPSKVKISDVELTFTKDGYVDRSNDARRLIELSADLGARSRLTEAAASPAPPQEPAPHEEDLERKWEQAASERRALDAVRARRDTRQGLMFAAFLGLAVVWFIAMSHC